MLKSAAFRTFVCPLRVPPFQLGKRRKKAASLHDRKCTVTENKKRGAPLILLDESRFQRSSRIGGEEGIRTLDPHVANVMLYQLSYFPIRGNGV